jgi:hypothetical protein
MLKNVSRDPGEVQAVRSHCSKSRIGRRRRKEEKRRSD